MNRQPIIVGALAIAVIALWNSWHFVDWRNSHLPRDSTWNQLRNDTQITAVKREPELWRDIKKTTVAKAQDGGYQPVFDEAIAAADGQRVELPGVGFLLKSGVLEHEAGVGEVQEFLLLPGDEGVAWCCGLSPIPNFEFSVLVDCSNDPFLTSKADPKSSAVFVNVDGILRLQKANSIDALYTLEDAKIEFIDMKDVIPPGVMNICLRKPMFP